jgi:CubicO group peptidase (beta-lactamase class C family)
VDESRAPAATNPGYGLQWWLDAGGESFRAEGLFGQRIIVVPELDLVVATNTTPGGEPGPMVDTVLAAFRGDPIPRPAPAGGLPASR